MAREEPPVASVWTRPPRRERQALSRDRIVREAVRLLDAEGVDALSMRNLGVRLGAGATSLYRHVASRDELLELVVDDVHGELRVPGATEAWPDALTGCAHELRAMMLRHPWVGSVLGRVGLAELGPNLLSWSEGVLAVLRTAGFPPGEAHQAMNALVAYVVGIGTSEAAYLSMLDRTGRTEEELAESLRPAAEQAVRHHPRLREAYAARLGDDLRQIRDQDFAYGLARLLDGLAARVDQTLSR